MADLLDELLSHAPQNGRHALSDSELAIFWGVSARQVRMLASEGVITRDASSRFDLQNSTKAYLRHLMARANRKTVSPEIAAEKLRLTREQADSVEIKNAAARRELVPASDVQSTWAAILRDVRASMLAIPGRVQSRLPHLTSHDLKILDSEIRVVLTESANDRRMER